METQPSDKFRVTCDHTGNVVRLAVWRGRVLHDLYVDRSDNTNLIGAIVAGKIVRCVPKQKMTYVDCGLDENVCVSGNEEKCIGDKVQLVIKNLPREGKAYDGVFLKKKRVSDIEKGIIVPPPPLWHRAINNFSRSEISAIAFEDRHDYEECRKVLEQERSSFLKILQPFSREKAHPELDEIIEGLLEPCISLSGGGEIVIEQTAALVAVDVNSASIGNALSVNLQAARELARQIRLRNLSGTIVMDALKMPLRTDNNKLLNALRQATEGDPAGVHVFGITRLGLVEMTRTRHGPSLAEVLQERRG